MKHHLWGLLYSLYWRFWPDKEYVVYVVYGEHRRYVDTETFGNLEAAMNYVEAHVPYAYMRHEVVHDVIVRGRPDLPTVSVWRIDREEL